MDGRQQSLELRPDLLVIGPGGAARVAEIKTGHLAPRLDHPATRRQLLEYALAFDVQGVLLVDAESGRIHEVTFPIAVRRHSGAHKGWAWLLAGATLGAAACWWWLRGG